MIFYYQAGTEQQGADKTKSNKVLIRQKSNKMQIKQHNTKLPGAPAQGWGGQRGQLPHQI